MKIQAITSNYNNNNVGFKASVAKGSVDFAKRAELEKVLDKCFNSVKDTFTVSKFRLDEEKVAPVYDVLVKNGNKEEEVAKGTTTPTFAILSYLEEKYSTLFSTNREKINNIIPESTYKQLSMLKALKGEA